MTHGARYGREHGAAIVAALLLSALVAILGASVLLFQETWLAELKVRNDRVRARELAHVGVDWARAVLADARKRDSVDHLGEAWAQPLAPIELDGATINGHIDDEQGKFDLNALARDGARDAGSIAAFSRLLEILGLPPGLAETLADWEDGYDDATSGGAENAYYLGLAKPYRTANGKLADIDELRWVRGYDDKIIARLRPYVTALPKPGTVNVNTASADVIAAVSGIPIARAAKFCLGRRAKPVTSLADIASRLDIPDAEGRFGVGSAYFLVTGMVVKDQVRVRIDALVGRTNRTWPEIIWIRRR